MDINWLDWFGYSASLIILISLVSTSIIKLRLINTIGATLFAIYGVLIASFPTAAMNTGIVFINIYYLMRIYNSKENYQIVETSTQSNFFKAFTSYYKEDIKNTFNLDHLENIENTLSFYVLRDMVPASLLVVKPLDEHTLEILVDFATPAYRDFKIGAHLYKNGCDFFSSKGYTTITSKAHVKDHEKYLLKMGFEKIDNIFTKKISQ